MNALAYQNRENQVNSLTIVPRTDMNTIRINTLVPGFTYTNHLGNPTQLSTDNGLKL